MFYSAIQNSVRRIITIDLYYSNSWCFLSLPPPQKKKKNHKLLVCLPISMSMVEVHSLLWLMWKIEHTTVSVTAKCHALLYQLLVAFKTSCKCPKPT